MSTRGWLIIWTYAGLMLLLIMMTWPWIASTAAFIISPMAWLGLP